MSQFDPFDQLGLGTSHPRRRDLRERSTARSRRAARRRAKTDRKARTAMKNSVVQRPATSSKPRKSIGKRIWGGLVSVVALALAAAFALATVGSPLLFSSTSATASIGQNSKSSATINGQALSAAPGKETQIDRGSFTALSADELYALEVGGLDYTVNNSGPIRWPFDYPVPLGDHFGPRAAPCPGCSTFHMGTDFETGDLAPIYAVAAGVVTISEDSGALGQHIAIEHDVNGYAFTSVYGHMSANSETVHVGDVITEGELVGLTGTTGESTGPHLDFEIDINGVPVDSFVWLKAHTAQ